MSGSSSRFLNTAAGVKAEPLPEQEYHVDTAREDYDLNFCLPVCDLEGSGVRLEPFIPSVHGRELFDILASSPEQVQDGLFAYLPYPRPRSPAQFLTFVESRIRRSPGEVLFAVHDTSRPGASHLSGWIALINASSVDLVAELGHLVTLPRAQRTHVTTNACALLIKYCLSPPSRGGLGLRKVEYRAHLLNQASNKVPPRFGFRKEGVLRNAKVLAFDKPGDALDPADGETGSPKAGRSRDTVVWAINWRDWQDDAKQKVEGLLARSTEPTR